MCTFSKEINPYQVRHARRARGSNADELNETPSRQANQAQLGSQQSSLHKPKNKISSSGPSRNHRHRPIRALNVN